MKQKIMFLGLAIAMTFGIVVTASGIDAPPECNYTNCPGGASQCCTEGGVTLYNWNPPKP